MNFSSLFWLFGYLLPLLKNLNLSTLAITNYGCVDIFHSNFANKNWLKYERFQKPRQPSSFLLHNESHEPHAIEDLKATPILHNLTTKEFRWEMIDEENWK